MSADKVITTIQNYRLVKTNFGYKALRNPDNYCWKTWKLSTNEDAIIAEMNAAVLPQFVAKTHNTGPSKPPNAKVTPPVVSKGKSTVVPSLPKSKTESSKQP